MPSTSGTHGSKSGSKSEGRKGASGKESSSSIGKQGGSHEQHVKAGEQSHKNSK
ncbi:MULTISPECIES: hypothetical protein [unclassified Rhizobium]|uniref:hypothetical protein n=1 Tax=unclassified Rhizobium TaxID=2613769 RepID=UPI000CDF345D|nr:MULTISPECIES: hypothetical protein [unclassified Rhizobium]AVA24906.1 hypothetical protein NXC24_PC00461 [Rhizobium sp. NXC24]WFU13046.1 hypothetical protein QA646_27200 [Rhizobium sp. CB3090]